MAEYFFNLPGSVRISNSKPIDGDRYLVDDDTARDLLVTNDRVHEGLQIYHAADKKIYYCDLLVLGDAGNTSWTEIGSGGGAFAIWLYGEGDNSIEAQSIEGVGQITVTNGSTSIVGVASEFTDATPDGLAFWNTLWVKDSNGDWYRINTSSITNDLLCTGEDFFGISDIEAGYATTNVTFPGVTGTYPYFIVKNLLPGVHGQAFGNNAYAKDRSTAFGAGVVATGLEALAIGFETLSAGDQAVAMNKWAHATGNYAFAGGEGFDPTTGKFIIASGQGAFNFSTNTTNQTAGHGALAPSSAILGGKDHNIPADSAGSVILGGTTTPIKARAADPDQVYAPNLNIAYVPSAGVNTDVVLVRESATGKIRAISRKDLLGAPISADKDLTPNVTSGDAELTGLLLTSDPAGLLQVFINGLRENIGDGVKTKACYFSVDGGTTAKALNAIAQNDQLIWNGTIAGYDLLGTFSVSLEYM